MIATTFSRICAKYITFLSRINSHKIFNFQIFKFRSKGLANLSTRILGSNTLIQGALPEILENTPQTFFDGLVDTLYVSSPEFIHMHSCDKNLFIANTVSFCYYRPSEILETCKTCL